MPKACSRLQLELGGTTRERMGMEGRETQQKYFGHNLCLYERKEHVASFHTAIKKMVSFLSQWHFRLSLEMSVHCDCIGGTQS